MVHRGGKRVGGTGSSQTWPPYIISMAIVSTSLYLCPTATASLIASFFLWLSFRSSICDKFSLDPSASCDVASICRSRIGLQVSRSQSSWPANSQSSGCQGPQLVKEEQQSSVWVPHIPVIARVVFRASRKEIFNQK